MDIFFNKVVIENLQISDCGIAVYLALRGIYNPTRKNHFISVNQLQYLLTGTINNNRRFIDDILSGINELTKLGFVDLIDSFNATEYVLNLSKLYFKNSSAKFGIIHSNEIETILKLNCSGNKLKLLRYYLVLIGTLINKDIAYLNGDFKFQKGVGAMTHTYLSKKCGISERSLIRYNKILQEEKLIYIFNTKDFRCTDDGIKSFTNTYGRYKDKDKVIACGKSYIKNYGENFDKTNKTVKQRATSHSRSMSNMFRYIRDKDKVYDYDTMKDIYFSMVEQNSKLRERYYKDDDYNKYKKDLTLFKEYDFFMKT